MFMSFFLISILWCDCVCYSRLFEYVFTLTCLIWLRMQNSAANNVQSTFCYCYQIFKKQVLLKSGTFAWYINICVSFSHKSTDLSIHKHRSPQSIQHLGVFNISSLHSNLSMFKISVSISSLWLHREKKKSNKSFYTYLGFPFYTPLIISLVRGKSRAMETL